jgi:hypothetical protein
MEIGSSPWTCELRGTQGALAMIKAPDLSDDSKLLMRSKAPIIAGLIDEHEFVGHLRATGRRLFAAQSKHVDLKLKSQLSARRSGDATRLEKEPSGQLAEVTPSVFGHLRQA